jgi:hypothetical protein
VIENSVLRRIFGPKRDEVRGDNLNILYCSANNVSNKLERNEKGGVCKIYGGEKGCIQSFGGEIWRKETTGETRAKMG